MWPEPDEFRPSFRDWDGDPFALTPQGGSNHYSQHRCRGKWITAALVQVAPRFLSSSLRYDVPTEDLQMDGSCMPTLPTNRQVISHVRP
ncbi:MAG: hypothetical protein GEU80_16275 [Dehalococcoidia bacterium]|nr:hypothetical protein [Dehalococcoidia bacterium]